MVITKQHLIDRQIENNGINQQNISFSDDAIKFIISGYTREAGLRNLEREIGSVCRKIAKMIVMGETLHYDVTPENIPELLGPPKFLKDDALKEPQVGIVTGLAWTQAGGDVLYVEALKMRGAGGLKLTGQLGDVMKESAQAAWSYAKANFEELAIPEDFFEKNEIHIHLPAGAIPKDGPSAGITLATALVSLMSDTPIRHDIAMTGEVTLQGRVLPVGGIREKCLAALSHGIKDIILPNANKKDVADIPEEFKKRMHFIFVDHLDEVFAVALDRSKVKKIFGTGNSGNTKPGAKKTKVSAASPAA